MFDIKERLERHKSENRLSAPEHEAISGMQSLAACPHCKDLEKQITELKLKIFWKEHCTGQLKLVMENANQNGPDCACLVCAVSGRKDEEKDAEPFPSVCAFKPNFEALLTECGLTIGYCDGVPVCEHESEPRRIRATSSMISTRIFVHVGRDDWFGFVYGAKLWRATTSDDPELQKLVSLFERLQPDEEE